MRADSVSGWYARLDRVCLEKSVQIWTWLDKWEESLKKGQPIAALLPQEWPTLPASLLTDPGRVLDQLLARHDAETDGRSPRSSHPTPPKLADSVIIAEMLGITYFQVITHAFIPAVIVYLSLFWISDLEASKLGLKGMNKKDIPELGKTFRSGLHFLIPIALLIYLLIIKRWTAGSSVFYSILAMMAIMIIQKIDYRKILNITSNTVVKLKDSPELSDITISNEGGSEIYFEYYHHKVHYL